MYHWQVLTLMAFKLFIVYFQLKKLITTNYYYSGHGICGMARFSIRSYVGVAVFMISGIMTASLCDMNGVIFRHLHTMEGDASMYLPTRTSVIVSFTIGSLIMVAGIIGEALNMHAPESATENEKIAHKNNSKKLLPAMASAFLFAIGLVVSQMTLFSKIYGFLNMSLIPKGTWDPTLLMVMGGGFAVSFISYQWVQGFNIFKVSLFNLRDLYTYFFLHLAHLYYLLIQYRTPVQLNVLYPKTRNVASSTSQRTRLLMPT